MPHRPTAGAPSASEQADVVRLRAHDPRPSIEEASPRGGCGDRWTEQARPLPRTDAPAQPLLAVEEHRVGRRVVLSVSGEVDFSTVAALSAAIDRAAAMSLDVWLDFTQTTFMDSSGVHALLEARSRLDRAGRRMVLICPEGPVLRLLTLTRIDQSLEIHSSRSAAHFAS